MGVPEHTAARYCCLSSFGARNAEAKLYMMVSHSQESHALYKHRPLFNGPLSILVDPSLLHNHFILRAKATRIHAEAGEG